MMVMMMMMMMTMKMKMNDDDDDDDENVNGVLASFALQASGQGQSHFVAPISFNYDNDDHHRGNNGDHHNDYLDGGYHHVDHLHGGDRI